MPFVFMTGAGTVQTSSASGFETLYAGYRWDGESPLMYYVRNRFLLPVIGTWNRRDPLGYVDWVSLSSYVQLSPLYQTDPMGLRKEKHHWFPQLGGAGREYVKKLCGDHGIELNIDDFTTELETAPGPHSWLHNNFGYHNLARLIYTESKNCCDMMTRMLKLSTVAWQAVRIVHVDLPFTPKLVPWKKESNGGEAGRLLLLLAKACKDCAQKPVFSCEAEFEICRTQAIDSYTNCVSKGEYFCGAKYGVTMHACYMGQSTCQENRTLQCVGQVLVDNPELVIVVAIGFVVAVAPETCPVFLPVVRKLVAKPL